LSRKSVDGAATVRFPDIRMRGHLVKLGPPAVIIAACVVLFATAPKNGDFWFSDASRHALNGIFVKDFLVAMPWHDPVGWAVDYYLRYPALTILFYPPLFYLIEAAAFSVFGFSHWTAQLTVAFFSVGLGIASYLVARQFLPRLEATGAALLTVGAPEIAFWGRQVMLDIPAAATLMLSLYFFMRYMAQDSFRLIVLCISFLLASLYIKFNGVFVLPVFAAVFIARKGLDRQSAVITTVTVLLLLLPAVYLTLKFGTANLQSIAGRPGDMARSSAASWLFYPELLPQLLGWPTLLLAIAGAGLAVYGAGTELRLWSTWLALGWLLVGYVFMSAIGVHEARHFLLVILPLPIIAAYALHALLPRPLPGILACTLGLAMVVHSAVAYPPPATTGYREIGDYVATHAPPNGIVLFSGSRDGTFIFNIRTHDERRDLSVIRADKLLLRVAIERVRGVEQTSYSEGQMLALLRERGIGLIVAQDEFWSDLDQMAKFSALLQQPTFQRLASFPVTDPGHEDDRVVTIYRPTYAVGPPRNGIELEMPVIGEKFSQSPP
jgi:hypothetical protein